LVKSKNDFGQCHATNVFTPISRVNSENLLYELVTEMVCHHE